MRDADDEKQLQAASERIYPSNAVLQAEWRRAVAVVRKTRRGYLLDKPVPKKEQPQ